MNKIEKEFAGKLTDLCREYNKDLTHKQIARQLQYTSKEHMKLYIRGI